MSKHTPGPWRVVKHDNLVVADDDRMTIMCNFPYSLSVEQNMADARLIAAAPELLDALRNLMEVTEEVARRHGLTYSDLDAYNDDARAAIAKATGE